MLSIKLFQFHKGTIRTPLLEKQGKINAFQFHKGTIRTLRFHRLLLKFRDFNSIKVRLERANMLSLDASIQFQFHKGTIRTRVLSKFGREYLISIP